MILKIFNVRGEFQGKYWKMCDSNESSPTLSLEKGEELFDPLWIEFRVVEACGWEEYWWAVSFFRLRPRKRDQFFNEGRLLKTKKSPFRKLV